VKGASYEYYTQKSAWNIPLPFEKGACNAQLPWRKVLEMPSSREKVARNKDMAQKGARLDKVACNARLPFEKGACNVQLPFQKGACNIQISREKCVKCLNFL